MNTNVEKEADHAPLNLGNSGPPSSSSGTPSANSSRSLPASFQEAWYIKLNDPTQQRALWLRFTLLSSKNGFKRVAEVWAIYFQKLQNRDVKKTAVKQSFDIGEFSSAHSKTIKIQNCELSQERTHGNIQSKGSTIQWDLNLTQGSEKSFSMIPEILTKMGLTKNSIVTDYEDLRFTGKTEINGEVIHWDLAPGMMGHLKGPKSAHSWTWGQCNTFLNEQGKPTDFIFEGANIRAKLGPITAPRLSFFYFHYQNQTYNFNGLKDAIYIKSKNTLNDWEFQADRGELSFRGYAHAEHKDFAGVELEDTDGSFLYCSSSQLSDMRVLIYRNGKLEATFTAQGTAAFEIASREKNPYVPLLI